VTVLDVSGAALARARARLGERGDIVSWLEADVTGDWTPPAVDIWHDRAVFHFLTDPAARAIYRSKLESALKPGGAAIVATFALEGPSRCSGLPVQRYSPETLSAELGPRFHLVDATAEAHHTPGGTTQAFWFTRFTMSQDGGR
jgi:hypothetical protein